MKTASEAPKNRRKVLPPAAGIGRKKGVPNRATTNAREAIARLVDANTEQMQDWLDEIRREQGALAAWRCMTDVLEYHIPKLARIETSGVDGKPQEIMVGWIGS